MSTTTINEKGKLVTREELDDIFKGTEEVKSNWVKFSKVGDVFKGTLLTVRQVESRLPGQEGKKAALYEFRGISGHYHALDENKKLIEEPILVNPGDMYNVGGKPIIDQQLRNVKLGTICVLHFAEERKPRVKGYNPFKIIKVRVGGMDPEYMGEQPIDIENIDLAE